MRFDAYAGNVYKASPEQVAEMISFGVRGRVERGKPRGRYSDVWEVKNLPADGSAWIGRDAVLEAAYFEIKGATTPEAVQTIRRHWGDSHTVSRLDSCEDYNAAGAYGQLVEVVDSACDPRVKSRAWQPRGAGAEEEGATIYWGSTQSRVQVRVYEAGKMKERVHHGKPNWARAEAQVRPGKAKEKVAAAKVTALDAWGFSAWSQRAAALLSHVEVQRFAPEAEPVQFDRTTLYLARAFRRHFEEMLSDFGSWSTVGSEIQNIWQADDDANAKRKANR
jgi:hypothetical protein